MKLATYRAEGDPRAGLVIGDRILDLAAASDGRVSLPMRELLGDEDAMAEAAELAAKASVHHAAGAEVGRPLADVELLAPVPRPGKVLCLGLNYRDHAAESGSPVPDEPVIFAKASSGVIGTGAAIRLPACSDEMDYEVELAIVIGRPAKEVAAADATECVAGYTVLNDVTARDYQRLRGGGQWTLAKSFDTGCPLGPWIVTKDEIPDPHALRLQSVVSGEVMQSSSTEQMIFTVPAIIEYLSACLTLEPGDVIGTGTPPGVGFARKPPRFLRDGDVVECTVQGIGTLTNPVKG
jgi:2-keto-4-pentenoate hydratase/2-oxohepta-3-ene-1,7-dioic acid hydratase in catechol pathway